MNLFDIIGPIMVGPSSSHTSGVVRIANVVYSILGQAPKKAIIKFHGSFAKTYLGHGSHKAVIAGLMGFKTDDSKIKNSLELAKEIHMEYKIEKINLQNAHPNTIIIEAQNNENEKVSILAESIGGGNILVKKIDNYDDNLDCSRDVLFINLKDSIGMISDITKILSIENFNIANMKVYREKKGGNGIILIETDEKLKNNVITAIKHLSDIINVKIIPSI